MMELLTAAVRAIGPGPWQGPLAELIADKGHQLIHIDGNARKRNTLMVQLPEVPPTDWKIENGRIMIGRAEDLSDTQRQIVFDTLMAFRPWRKGPFRIFGIDVDTEWCSDLKWERIASHLAPLQGRRILDVGSSCGYYLMRMAPAEPRLALGLEPYPPLFCQYALLQRWLKLPQVHCLPVKLEELPPMDGYFDTIFHMGVLYHQRSPHDALKQLAALLRPGGELVLETLVLDGNEDLALCPRDRYAKMRNVFFLPTVPCLEAWLAKAGFTNIRCVDRTWTTIEEQHPTSWINTESLPDFLDPGDSGKTVEGYQAPLRAALIARRR
jgi:tRNA (mo5U34)-methyltransferase